MAFYDSTDAVYGFARYGSASYGIVQPTVALTGVSATANTRTIHLNVFEVDITEPLYNAQAATGFVGGITVNTAAGLSGVLATGTINTVGASVDVTADSVASTVAIGTAKINTTEVVSSVAATATLDTTGLTVKSVNTVSVTLHAATGSVGTVEPKTLEALESVSATTAINNVQVNLTQKLTLVAITSSIGSVNISNKIIITSVKATGQIGTLGGGTSEKIAVGVEATGYVNGVTVNVHEVLEAAASVIDIGTVTTTTINFDFEAVKDLYSHRRTVVLPRAA